MGAYSGQYDTCRYWFCELLAYGTANLQAILRNIRKTTTLEAILLELPVKLSQRRINPLSTDGHYSGHFAKLRFLQNWQI